MIAFAAVLALAAAVAWIVAKVTRSDARFQLRLAAVLYAVMAVASLSELTRSGMTLTATALGPGLVALTFLTRCGLAPPPALSAAVLSAMALAGIAAAATGMVAFAVAPQLAAVTVILAMSRRPLRARAGLYRILAALAFLGAAGSLLMTDRIAAVAVLLFCAAGLLASAVSLVSDGGVDLRKGADARLAVGGPH